MMKKTKVAGLLAAMTLSFGAQASVIDLFALDQLVPKDFTDGSFTAADSSYTQAGPDGSIIGSYRDLIVSNLSGGINSVSGSSINVVGGQLRFSTDTGTVGQGQVQWDGDDSAIGANPIFDVNATGLGGLNLGADGSTAFQLITEFSDLGWVFELTMYKDAFNYTTVSVDASSVGGVGGLTAPHVSYIPFSAFTNAGFCGTYGAAPGVNAITCVGTGADTTSVGALVATINAGDPLAPDGIGSVPQARTAAVDLQLSSVTTVPEPSAIALVGLGLLGLGAVRRKTGRQG